LGRWLIFTLIPSDKATITAAKTATGCARGVFAAALRRSPDMKQMFDEISRSENAFAGWNGEVVSPRAVRYA
jgi:hypothetical protein